MFTIATIQGSFKPYHEVCVSMIEPIWSTQYPLTFKDDVGNLIAPACSAQWNF